MQYGRREGIRKHVTKPYSQLTPRTKTLSPSPQFVSLWPVVSVPPECAVLVVVLGGVEVGVEAVALHLAEQVHPLTPRPGAVVEALRKIKSLRGGYVGIRPRLSPGMDVMRYLL